jgi:hypothetical protein
LLDTLFSQRQPELFAYLSIADEASNISTRIRRSDFGGNIPLPLRQHCIYEALMGPVSVANPMTAYVRHVQNLVSCSFYLCRFGQLARSIFL